VPIRDPLSPLEAQRLWRRSEIKEFAFPQAPRATSHVVVRPQRNRTDRADHEDRELAHVSEPGLPAAGDITVVPELILPPRRLAVAGRPVEPLYVYPPDKRRVFKDTTFPWRACGKVSTGGSGSGAGALVGPRHLLTASHVVDWTATDNGWLLFQPDYYEGDVFPSSYAESVYSYEQIGNPQGEYDVAEDYVVCVLQERLGDQLGWLGATTYTDDWDGTAAFNHVGYPTDVGGGRKPAWELFFSIANSWNPGFFESGHALDIETFASLNHGDSGGPVFAWWPDGGPYGGAPAGPYVVAVVSAQGTLGPVVTDPVDRTANWLAGGSELPDLVNQARSEYP